MFSPLLLLASGILRPGVNCCTLPFDWPRFLVTVKWRAQIVWRFHIRTVVKTVRLFALIEKSEMTFCGWGNGLCHLAVYITYLYAAHFYLVQVPSRYS